MLAIGLKGRDLLLDRARIFRQRLIISIVQLMEIAFDTRFYLDNALLHLGFGKVFISVIHRFKLAAQHHELATDQADGFTIVFPEVSDSFEVRGKPTGEPHQLNIAFSFPF